MIDKNRIREFINTHLMKTDRHTDFMDSDNLFELKLVNSLFAMRLLKFLETEFNVRFDEEDLEFSNFSSVDNISHFLEKKKVS